MKITIYDDKKETDHSFEATFDIYLSTGYGATQEEAIADLKKSALALIEKLNNIDYTDVDVINVDGTLRLIGFNK